MNNITDFSIENKSDEEILFHFGKESFEQEDYDEAFRLFGLSASQGYAPALFELAYCYEEGLGIIADINKAFDLYTQSAELGYADAEYELAICYEKGKGIKKNLSKAIMWYEKAANNGIVEAQFNLAQSYLKGYGVLKNYDKAVYWLEKACAQNDPHAQYYLGWCYATGTGVKTNTAMAKDLLRRSSKNGIHQAEEMLAQLKMNKSHESIINKDSKFEIKVNDEIVERLMKIDYFSNCTMKIVPDIKYGYEFVTKSVMRKSCNGIKWQKLRLELIGDLTAYLCNNYNDLYNSEYNNLIDTVKEQYIYQIDKLYIDKLEDVFGEEKVLHSIHWDILHIIVADTFKDLFSTELYPDLLKVYESGQFPCGWRGKFPHGNMMIY